MGSGNGCVFEKRENVDGWCAGPAYIGLGLAFARLY